MTERTKTMGKRSMVGLILESDGEGQLSWKGASPSPAHMGEAIMVEMCPTVEPKRRTCNRHEDCDDADAKALGQFVRHCYDDTCEDCLGR